MHKKAYKEYRCCWLDFYCLARFYSMNNCFTQTNLVSTAFCVNKEVTGKNTYLLIISYGTG